MIINHLFVCAPSNYICVIIYTILMYLLVVNYKGNRYSVMQSDRNSFSGDVVPDRFIMAFRDEDRMLDQI